MTQRRQTAPGTSTGGGPRRTSTADLLLPSYPQDPLSLPSYPQGPQSPPNSPPALSKPHPVKVDDRNEPAGWEVERTGVCLADVGGMIEVKK